MPTSPSTLPSDTLLQPTSAGIARAAKLIADGKLVVLPTETVYGIAVNLLSPQARAAATAIKGSPPQWVLHVATPEEVFVWAPGLSQLASRLVDKALPGPVAFRIKLTAAAAAAARARLGEVGEEMLPVRAADPANQNFLTIRCPESAPTQSILAAAGVPIAIIGAGTPQQPGVFEVADLPEGLFAPETPSSTDEGAKPHVAVVLDGGPTRYRRPSTVVQLVDDQFSVVRAGVIDERIIQKLADYVVLFVCSGNTCRSPMASAIATKYLADKLAIHPSELPLRHIVVQSAGVHASRGHRATREAVAAVKSLGADLSGHMSQPASTDLLRRADVIYTMTAAHREELLQLMPGIAKKTFRLDPEADVADPIGSDFAVYQQVAEHLSALLRNRLSELRL